MAWKVLGAVCFAEADCWLAGEKQELYSLKLRPAGDMAGLSVIDIVPPLLLAVLVLFSVV